MPRFLGVTMSLVLRTVTRRGVMEMEAAKSVKREMMKTIAAGSPMIRDERPFEVGRISASSIALPHLK